MQKTLDDRFNRAMRACGLKITKQRTALFEVLYRANQPLLPRQIAARVDQVDQSSVYRNLALFARHKIARKVSKGFRTLYELGDTFSRHQHQVVCERCGRTVTMDCRQLEALINRMTITAGMRPVGHHVELIGLCRDCQRRLAAERRRGRCEHC
jgi:Fur family ferric uptake transcriptional regulator